MALDSTVLTNVFLGCLIVVSLIILTIVYRMERKQ
jgi:hypothetical protein